MTTIEEWKSVPNYEDSYEASNLGKVRSLDRVVFFERNGCEVKRFLKGKEMKVRQPTKTLSYCSVSFVKNSKQKTRTLHRLIAELFLDSWDESLEVDHIDGDIFNNKADNFRMASSQQQKFNSKKRTGVSSQFKGVGWDKRKQKWRARIVIESKEKFIGYYTDEVEAAIAYDNRARQVHGEFFKSCKMLEQQQREKNG